MDRCEFERRVVFAWVTTRVFFRYDNLHYLVDGDASGHYSILAADPPRLQRWLDEMVADGLLERHHGSDRSDLMSDGDDWWWTVADLGRPDDGASDFADAAPLEQIAEESRRLFGEVGAEGRGPLPRELELARRWYLDRLAGRPRPRRRWPWRWLRR